MTDEQSANLLWALLKLLREMEKTMSAGLDNLNAAVAALTTEVSTILADIQTALQNDDPDAAVQAASDVVNAAIANLQAGDPVTGTTPPPPPTTGQAVPSS